MAGTAHLRLKVLQWPESLGYTLMFIEALFTIAKTRKQPKCPSTEEWIKKMCICIYTMEYMYHIFLIHSSVDGHLSCFHVLAVVYSATLEDMYLFESWFSLDRCPGVGLLDRMQFYFEFSEDSPYCFPQWLHQFTTPPTV